MQTLVAEILAAWRRAERLSATLQAGSLEQSAALVAAYRLRELYQDLVKVAGKVEEADARALLAELAELQGRGQEPISDESPAGELRAPPRIAEAGSYGRPSTLPPTG
jgi:hypothetical protein